MRVRFLQDHNEAGFAEHRKGETVILDRGVAGVLLIRGVVTAAPLTDDEIVVIASEPRPGDEQQRPEDIARRVREQIQIIREIN